MRPVWIWQRNFSPHVAGLVGALSHIVPDVRYIVEAGIQDERRLFGWKESDLGRAGLAICGSPQEARALVQKAPRNCEHLFQGVRGNGSLAFAQEELGALGIGYWPMIETIGGGAWLDFTKRRFYGRVFRQKGAHIRGVLAIGHGAPAWIKRTGFPADRIFPFTYFLPEYEREEAPVEIRDSADYRVLFVGQLIKRKNIDVLISAFARLVHFDKYVRLTIVGNGPCEQALKRLVYELGISGSVHFVGSVPIDEVPLIMRRHDLLVLPSRHDGWGVVVSEALMAGTPAITTDGCGAAEAVDASGVGAVVPVRDVEALTWALQKMAEEGVYCIGRRNALASWGRAFGASAGARYVVALQEAVAHGLPVPLPPWRQSTAPHL